MTKSNTATYVVDPPVQVIIDAIAGANADPAPMLDEERKRANDTMLLLARPVPDSITVTDHSVPVAGGSITVRTYRPASAPATSPAYLFIHGGGWFQGNIETSEIECWPLAEATNAVVASVDYRLAPEYKFPAAIDDCVAAYTWLHTHATELGIDPQPRCRRWRKCRWQPQCGAVSHRARHRLADAVLATPRHPVHRRNLFDALDR